MFFNDWERKDRSNWEFSNIIHLGFNIHASQRTKQFICISFSILAWEPSAAQCPGYHRLPALGRKL